MDRLWAPWRKAYISGKKDKRCFICREKKSRNSKKSLVVGKSRLSIAVLNLYPYNNGHVLICPKRHVKMTYDMTKEEMLDLWELTNRMVRKMEKTMKTQGFNVGVNLGRVSGAGIPGHLHLHIVPRWIGDSNFMPVIGETKVVSESLESVKKRLNLTSK